MKRFILIALILATMPACSHGRGFGYYAAAFLGGASRGYRTASRTRQCTSYSMGTDGVSRLQCY
jgi:hypothetical protein